MYYPVKKKNSGKMFLSKITSVYVCKDFCMLMIDFIYLDIREHSCFIDSFCYYCRSEFC